MFMFMKFPKDEEHCGKARRAGLFTVAIMFFALRLGSHTVHAQINDDFNDNTINPSLWTVTQSGFGPTVAETNQRLEITFPAGSAGDMFGAGYVSVYRLRGDFDIQVDYHLLVWPSASGVRVGLGVSPPGGAVQRVGLGTNDSPDWPREVYVTDFGDGVQGIATSDSSGKLRLVRSGTILSGYYLSSGNWVLIHSSSVSTDDTSFWISAWSHDYAFGDQVVKVAFDNLYITVPSLPPQRCVGGHGSQCAGKRRNRRDGKFSGWVSVGSILHDNCCIINYPNGFMCHNGGANDVCQDEWNKAVSNSLDGYLWWENGAWGPYVKGQGDDITPVPARRSEPRTIHETRTTLGLAAPSGTELDISDEDFCESGRFLFIEGLTGICE